MGNRGELGEGLGERREGKLLSGYKINKFLKYAFEVHVKIDLCSNFFVF